MVEMIDMMGMLGMFTHQTLNTLVELQKSPHYVTLPVGIIFIKKFDDFAHIP